MLQLIGDHLWQSTVCGGVAWLLTLVLRKNHAGIRFWVWFAASMKFLVPLAALVALGAAMPWKPAPVAARSPIEMFELVSQPFSTGVAAVVPAPQPERWTVETLATTGAPVIWMLGMLLVLGVWLVRWRRIRAAVAAATEDADSRERLLLSRLASERGLPAPALRLSTGAVEPAVIGVRRPVLLWPTGISARLTDAQMEAILAHELAHIARRDNLLALVHMGVQALFWFHPLVWFVGTRLVHERERACDEDVVRRSGQREAYAEGILRTCEHCVESSLSCAAGVTGADLKQRIATIMRAGASRTLTTSARVLLAATTCVAIGIPVAAGLFGPVRVFAQLPTPVVAGASPAFDVISIRPRGPEGPVSLRPFPNRAEAINYTVESLILAAYGLRRHQLVGAPDWTKEDRFDVIGQREEVFKPGEGLLMIRELLASRFNLRMRVESRERPVYVLTWANTTRTLGPGLRISANDAVCGSAGSSIQPGDPRFLPGGQRPPCPGEVKLSPGRIEAKDSSLRWLVRNRLPYLLDRDVIDETGFTRWVDIELDFSPDLPSPPTSDGAAAPRDDRPTLFTALKEQLGLALVPAMRSVDVMVIDHVERPSDNNATPAPIALRQAAAAQPAPVASSALLTTPPFTASVKPSPAVDGALSRLQIQPGGRMTVENATVQTMLRNAYAVQEFQIVDGPAWITSERFDILAKADGNPTAQQMSAVLRQILTDRFHLVVRRDTRPMSVYALTALAARGPELRVSAIDCSAFDGTRPPPSSDSTRPVPPCGFRVGPGTMSGRAVAMGALAGALSTRMGRPVIDRTGLAGTFDLDLRWAPDQGPAIGGRDAVAQPVDPDGPSLLTALREQLGLRLESMTSPADVLVVTAVARPTAN